MLTRDWKSGKIGNIEYQVKSFDEGSIYGIDEGRISKLWMRDTKTRKVVANYDRGWDIEPDMKDGKVVAAYKAIIEKYN